MPYLSVNRSRLELSPGFAQRYELMSMLCSRESDSVWVCVQAHRITERPCEVTWRIQKCPTELLSLTQPSQISHHPAKPKCFIYFFWESKNSLTSGICWSKGLKNWVMKFYTQLLPWFSHWCCNGTYVYASAKEGNTCTISITPVFS